MAMVPKIIKYFIFFILYFVIIWTCSKEPTRPVNDNPFDPANPATGGDPFRLQAQIANGGITLTWNRPAVQGLASFRVYRSEQESSGYSRMATVDRNTTQYTDQTVLNGHIYWYRVSAINSDNVETNVTNTMAVNIKTDPLLVINGGEPYTPRREVSLTILANTAQQMLISNYSDFQNAQWESYATSKNWMLLTGEGQKTVYMKVKYENGNESAVVSASISPQPMNPGITIAGGAQYSLTRSVELTLTATGSNLAMKVSEDSSFAGLNWQPYQNAINFMLSTGEGPKMVYAKFKNDFEIESAVVFDDILPQPMNPGITIAGGAQYSATRSVELTLTATGSNLAMKVSEDSSFAGLNWQPYQNKINFTLSTGEGVKTVYAKFKNDFEIESAVVSNSILLDTTAPVPILSVSPDSGVTSETTFQFDPTASFDNLCLLNEMQIRFDWENNGIWSGWSNLQITGHQYTVGGGNKTARMELLDGAGWTADTSVTVFVNTRPVAQFTATQDPSNSSLFHFDASSSSDYEDGTNLQYRWDWENNGNWTAYSTNDTASHQYQNSGEYTVKLEVRDTGNLTSIKISQIAVQMTVTDIDGNVYRVVRIGNQYWMAENLKVTHYRNGDPIPNVTDNAQWTALSSGAYCNYNNDPSLADIYGRLYNWFAVADPRGLAPVGWHVPSDAEWEILVNYLGGAAVAGGALKEAGLAHWNSPNTGATNSSGFTALPGGYRSYLGYFYYMGYIAIFWSSTEYSINYAWSRSLLYDSAQVNRGNYVRPYGLSVRCVRD